MVEYFDIPYLILGCEEFVDNHITRGWRPYLLTFMFKSLRGPMNSIIDLMHDEIHRSYSILIKRFARHPKSPSSKQHLPMLLAFPDKPVSKRIKMSLRDVTTNGGLHFHGILLVPPVTRFKGCLVSHFSEERRGYLNNNLARLEVKEITHEPGYVVDYGMKSLKRKTVEFDDVWVLPKCVNELPSKTKKTTPEDKAIKDLQSHWNCSDEVADSMLSLMANKTGGIK
jgi:hypothetical protein